MTNRKSVVLTEARARQLLRRAAVAIAAGLLVPIACLLLLAVVPESLSGAVLIAGVSALIAGGLWFLGVLGHLAAGLGRSPVYWCGGTFLAQKILFVVAWLIAWALMRRAVDETYGAAARAA